MTENEYRSYPAVSRSDLWQLVTECPEKYKFFKNNPQLPTDALLFGQAFHMAVLQPELYSDNYIAAPVVDRRTKDGKATWELFCKEAGNKIVISKEWQDKILAMKNELIKNPFVNTLLSGEHEKPYFWKDELTGEECKCRADCITNIGGKFYIVDIKTAESAATDVFVRHSLKYGYHVQAAMYCEGFKQVTGNECSFVFIAIEKSPPYAVNIMQVDKIYRTYGYDIFREALEIYHNCKINDDWYGYLGKERNINILELPSYLAKEI